MNLDNFAEILVDQMPDGLLATDAEGLIRFWNGGAERIFGFSQAEAIGQSLDLIIPEKLRVRHWDGYAETMRSGQTKYGAGELLSVPAMRKDGARISIQFSIVPIAEAGGGLTGIAAIMRDVTAEFDESKRLKTALVAASARTAD